MGKNFIKSNKKRLLWAAAILVGVLAVGITLGFMFRETAQVDNTFERAVVSCEVVEVFDSASGVKSSIAVKNTGNIPSFLRVCLVSYWVNADGEIIGKPSQKPVLTLASGWKETADGIYEYGIAVAPNQTTPNLLADGEPIVLATDADGNRQVIEAFAEAIQSDPQAAKENWQ